MSNKLKIAIIYEGRSLSEKTYIEFSPEEFKKLLKKYFKQYKSIDKSLDCISEDLKKKTFYM